MQVIREVFSSVIPGLIKERGPVNVIVIGASETSCGEVMRFLKRVPVLQASWVEDDLKKTLAHLITCDNAICRHTLWELMAKNRVASRAT